MEQSNQCQQKKKEQLSKKPLNQFIKYSGMSFQMLGPVLLGYYGGAKLDTYFGLSGGLQITCILIGVFGGLYIALKDFIKG